MSSISYFKIGLFFLIGIFVGGGGLFWVSSAGLFQDRSVYMTFMDTSVEGLNPGSGVQYLGLDVGQVSDIDLIADEKLVKITLSFDTDFEVRDWMAVQLKMKSITGNKYLAVVEAPDDLERISPDIDTKDEYPVIPSIPGQIEQIVSTLETVYKQTREVDLSELISEWKKVAGNTNEIIEDGQIEKAVQDIREVSRRLENVTASLSGPESAKEWEQAFEDIRMAAGSARAAARNLEEQLGKVPSGRVADITGQAETTLSTIKDAAGSTDAQIDEAMRLIRYNLQQVDEMLAEFKKLARTLRRQPGRILSQPPEQEPFER